MVICTIPDVMTWLIDPSQWIDAVQAIHWDLPMELAKLGDKPLEVDLGGDVQKSFDNFVKTGQVWAFLIGIILGYLVKTFTTYG